MGRLGVPAHEVRDLCEQAHAGGVLSGLMSHFATADEADTSFFEQQLGRFAKLTAELKEQYPGLLCHTANSAATLRGPRAHFDMVRTGIAMYGLAPANDDPFKDGLRPAMKFVSYVAGVREAVPGDSVGYGRTWYAVELTRIGIVPVGYADGVRRALGNRGEVLVAGTALSHRRQDQHGPDDRQASRRLGRGGRRGRAVRRRRRRRGRRLRRRLDGARGPAPGRPRDAAHPLRGDGADARHHQLRGRLRRGAAGGAPLPRRDPRVLTPVTARYAATLPTPDEVTRAALAALGPGEAGWLVGGCLRDELLGRRVRDIDIVVDGRQEALARGLADRFEGAVYATSDLFGGWRVVVGDLHIDVAAVRGGPPGGPPDPETRAVRLEADLRARDVTVDALARPLDGDDLVDPLSGLDDLAAGRLRLCSPASLDDDPLRVLRLARLARVFDLVPDAAATEAAFRAAPGLARVSGERIRDELCALLGTRAAPVALRDLAVWGALAVVLPEVDRLRGVEQNPYHHLDVFEHTLEALTYVVGVVAQLGGRRFLTTPAEAGLPGVEPLVPVSWAVLLHDIGKPVVRVVDEQGRVIFWHHDETGRQMCADIGRRFNMSNRFVEYVGTLVRQHLRLGFLTREQPLTRRALARYRRDVSPWVFESVVVSLCDRLATRGEKTSLTSMARHYRLARTVWTAVSKAPAPQLLSGDDVMALLGIEPGPAVGQALDALEEEVEAGEVTDADGARAFLQEWWERDEGDAGEDDAGAGDGGEAADA